jgi:flagellar biosynthesis protein FliR
MDNNTVHVILGLIFAITMITLTAIEAYFIPFTQISFLWLVFQNIGLGFANSFYAGRIVLSAQGEQIETTKQAGQ